MRIVFDDLPHRPAVDMIEFLKELEWAILKHWGGRPLGCMSRDQTELAAQIAVMKCVTIDAPAVVLEGETRKGEPCLTSQPLLETS